MKKHFQKTKKPAFSHDKFFKAFFSNPKFARELLELVFSKAEAQAYDLNKIKIEKDTHEEKEPISLYLFLLKLTLKRE